jgi:hypothetical protein
MKFEQLHPLPVVQEAFEVLKQSISVLFDKPLNAIGHCASIVLNPEMTVIFKRFI